MPMRKVSLPMMTRVGAVQPKTLNREKRTVDVIFTTGARVLRRGFFSPTFFEELSLKKGHVRMGRLESGNAPVLDTHGFTDKRGIRQVIGVVESAKIIAGKEGRATLRFSKRAEVEEIFQDIEDGIVRNISIGYTTHKFEKVGEENEIPIFRATDWEPAEISTVPIGADSGAQIRINDQIMTDCVLIEDESETRDEETDSPDKIIKNENEILEKQKEVREVGDKPIKGDEMTPEELKKLEEKARLQGIAEENLRQTEIRSIIKKVGLDETLAEKYIKEAKSVDEVRTLVIDELAAKDDDPKNQTPATNIDMGEDLGRAGRIEGMTSALLHKFRPKPIETRENGQKIILPGYELNEQGRSYAYFSLIDMGRACLEGNNIRTGMMPKHKIADAMIGNVRGLHSTSDFPEILANVANKTLRGGYLAAPQTWRPFTTIVSVSDFKEISRTNLGDAPKLEKLEEGSEVKRGSISEAAEKYNVEEFAVILAFTRKTIINDDLAAFTRVPERMGRRSSDLESDTVWDIIKDNANLADGFALYSNQHNNLSTAPAVPNETGLSEGRKLIRRQTGLDGAKISLSPVWFYVPPEQETVAEKLIAQIIPNTQSSFSPFSSSGRTPLRLDVEPRLEDGPNGSLTAWFLFADLGQVDMIELAFLEGTDGPQLQTRDGFDINGVEMKIMHDLGAKAIDFRGLYKNAGA